MNYSELSLEELKEIAKEKGIVVGNTGKEKLIEKIEKYDLENNAKALIDGTDIENDLVADEVVDVEEEKENGGLSFKPPNLSLVYYMPAQMDSSCKI